MKNTMKKISAILVLSLFIVGMFPVAVFAQKASVKKVNQKFLVDAAKGKDQYQKVSTEIKNDVKNIKNFLVDVKNKEEFTRDDSFKIKQKLLDFLDSIINRAERTKTAVDNSCVDDDNGNDFLDRVIDWAEDLKTEVEALDPETATRNDINRILSKIKNGWGNVRGIVYVGMGRSIACKYRYIHENAETLIDRIKVLTDEAEANGKDVSRARTWITNAELKLSTLETDWDRIVNLWRQVDTSQDALNVAKKSNGYLKNAYRTIREMYKEAKTIYRYLKSQ